MFYQSPTDTFFNKLWYKRTYNLNIPDKMLSWHYHTQGHKQNLNPSLYFNTEWFRKTYNIPNHIDPLEYFMQHKSQNLKPNDKSQFYIRDIKKYNRVGWTNISADFVPLETEKQRINLLLPGEGCSAGPATLYRFANFLCEKGHSARIVFLYGPSTENFRQKLKTRYQLADDVELVYLLHGDLAISYKDVFIGSSWWSVYPLQFILGYLEHQTFFWFIQENELLLHEGDEIYAKALSCYHMNYYSFINTSILYDDLKKHLYPFNTETYSDKLVCFEPAFDTTQLYYEHKPHRRPLTVIFYSRDATVAKRNCVRLLHTLLRESYLNELLTKDDKVYGFGQAKKRVQLSKEFYYEDLGFLDLDKYYSLFRKADILISFQMAPHPSYPPLEMSFCNGLTIHTNFGYKTQESISRYTDKIIMCEPNILSLLEGMKKAVTQIRNNDLTDTPPKLLHTDWYIPFSACYRLLKNVTHK